MDKNFKTRLVVGLSMFVIAVVGMYTFDEIPFKVIFTLFAMMSAVELVSFFKKKVNALNIFLALLEILFLVGGVIFVIVTDVAHFWYIILGVCGYDVFAYLFGKACGGKIFKKSRPFPYVSKNKTWEGTVLGLLTSVALVAILMGVRNSFEADWIYLFCGMLGLMGDLFESFLKRKFEVKDSNEIVIKNKVFCWLEMLVGGSEGHGGFLDRIDSTAFTTSVLLIIMMIMGK